MSLPRTSTVSHCQLIINLSVTFRPDTVQQRFACGSAEKRHFIVQISSVLCSVLCWTEHKPMSERLTAMKEIQFPEVKVAQLLQDH